jgi:phosphate transport system protein
VSEPHTDRGFDDELRVLGDRLLGMGARCEQQIRSAMRALTEHDDTLARGVIDADQAIDRDEIEIDELAFQMLATRQPVAGDLRFVTMALKFVTDLERIGDLAAGIAKRTLELSKLPGPAPDLQLAALATMVEKNLRAALDAFVTRDADAATRVIDADRHIDKLNASIFAELLAQVATRPDTVVRIQPLTLVCRHLERIGDHVKNLAEEVVYMVRAQDIRHRPPS